MTQFFWWLLSFGLLTGTARQHRVLPGIDVLLTDSARLIRGKRLGLITNQSGIDAAGVPTIDRLARDSATRLVMLFAPEHGLRGTAAPGASVGDSVDRATGLPIYSLYGANRAPTPAQLARIDALVVDLQDVGTATWTYVTTLVYAMRAAARAGKRVIVLDRPDPIGCAVAGPSFDSGAVGASFIRPLPVPLRHGMTLGELARFANRRLAIGADLVVVPVKGWSRCEWFDATGLPWVRPSPNLPDLESTAWYPGMVLFEATNLSVGRGTDAPFRQIGAPWLDTTRLVREARQRGVAVRPVVMTPDHPGDGRFAGKRIPGVRLTGNGRSGDVIAAALRLLDAVQAIHPDSLRIDSTALAIRLGARRAGRQTQWPFDVRQFMHDRRPDLLYC